MDLVEDLLSSHVDWWVGLGLALGLDAGKAGGREWDGRRNVGGRQPDDGLMADEGLERRLSDMAQLSVEEDSWVEGAVGQRSSGESLLAQLGLVESQLPLMERPHHCTRLGVLAQSLFGACWEEDIHPLLLEFTDRHQVMPKVWVVEASELARGNCWAGYAGGTTGH